MKLGVFDSGIGGEAVALELKRAFPDAEIICRNDKTNVPYGDKSPLEVRILTETAIRPFLDGTFDVIILACNTATALAIEHLRNRYPKQKFIGIEPMIKPAAALTKSGTVAVFATPATLSSHRYAELIARYGRTLTLLEPNCSDWAYLIESNTLNRERVASVVEEVCTQGADVIVLGCTHYHWIKDLVVELSADQALVLEPSEAIGRRVSHYLHQ